MSTPVKFLEDISKDNFIPEKDKKEFIDLCISGDAKRAAEYLEKTPELVNTYSKGNGFELEPPLVIAVAKNHYPVLDTLLRYKPNVDAVCKEGPLNGMPAVFFAAKEGKWDMVERLLESGANPNNHLVNGSIEVKESCEAETLLWLAISQEEWSRVPRLLKLGVRNLDSGMLGPPLAWCAEQGEDITFRLLLAEGASLELPDKSISLERLAYLFSDPLDVEKVARVKTTFEAASKLFELADNSKKLGDEMLKEELRETLSNLGHAINGRINGKTALQVAIEKGNLIVIEGLVNLIREDKGIEVLLPEWDETTAQLALQPSTLAILKGGKLQAKLLVLEKALDNLKIQASQQFGTSESHVPAVLLAAEIRQLPVTFGLSGTASSSSQTQKVEITEPKGNNQPVPPAVKQRPSS